MNEHEALAYHYKYYRIHPFHAYTIEQYDMLLPIATMFNSRVITSRVIRRELLARRKENVMKQDKTFFDYANSKESRIKYKGNYKCYGKLNISTIKSTRTIL